MVVGRYCLFTSSYCRNVSLVYQGMQICRKERFGFRQLHALLEDIDTVRHLHSLLYLPAVTRDRINDIKLNCVIFRK